MYKRQSRGLAAQVEVVPGNWNDQKPKVPGFTAPSNKYFATRQRLAYHATATRFGAWIIDAPAKAQTAPPPPPPPAPEPQVQQTSSSGEKSKAQSLEDYEADYLKRLEQKKVDDAKAAAEEAEAAAAASAQSSKGSMPKGWKPS